MGDGVRAPREPHIVAEICRRAAIKMRRQTPMDNSIPDFYVECAETIEALEEQVEKLLDEYAVLESLAVRCISPNGGGSYTQKEALAELERQLRGRS